MEETLTNDTKAIILLCGVLDKKSSVEPLTQTEYTRLVQWLMSHQRRPHDLIKSKDIEKISKDTGLELERLKALLRRGVQLGFAIEEWQQKSIWIISRSDTDYPKRLKQHLKEKAPPLLFGVGNRDLLQGGGIAIVGSRNVDSEGVAFTQTIAELCATSNLPIVSGGARGVDQIAMKSSLDAGGTTIGILAENLLSKSLEREARKAINDKRLLLISPYHPNARFTVGTAMGRNKLIYAMADFGLVISAEINKGGTWSGAKEELSRKQAIPIFVRQGENVPPGNKKLLELGAIEWPEDINGGNLVRRLTELAAMRNTKVEPEHLSIFDYMEQQASFVEDPGPDEKRVDNSKRGTTTIEKTNPADLVYRAVMPVILDQLISPVSADDLAKELNLSLSQLNKWLERAVGEGKVAKLKKPVRYKAVI